MENEAPPPPAECGAAATARPRLAAAGPIQPQRAPGSARRPPPARTRLLTDFKAERKHPSGPERGRAQAAATSNGGDETSASGTNARGRGEGRAHAPPGAGHPALTGRTGGEGPGRGRGPALRPRRRLRLLCLARPLRRERGSPAGRPRGSPARASSRLVPPARMDRPVEAAHRPGRAAPPQPPGEGGYRRRCPARTPRVDGVLLPSGCFALPEERPTELGQARSSGSVQGGAAACPQQSGIFSGQGPLPPERRSRALSLTPRCALPHLPQVQPFLGIVQQHMGGNKILLVTSPYKDFTYSSLYKQSYRLEATHIWHRAKFRGSRSTGQLHCS
ncbi:uncharacterized protein LJ264_004791 [Porphyrio hochstetteri]